MFRLWFGVPHPCDELLFLCVEDVYDYYETLGEDDFLVDLIAEGYAGIEEITIWLPDDS